MASPDEFEYDPERALWRPGRRTFLFMLGGALAGTVLPASPAVPESAMEYLAEIAPIGRPKMVDPRQLLRATFMELHGDLSLTKELGLKPFQRKVVEDWNG